MSDRCRKSDSLKVLVRDPAEPLKGNGQLDPTTIMRELMDLVDDDESNRLEMPLHDFSWKNGLEGLGRGDEKVWWNCGLFPPFRLWSIAMAHRDSKLR
jgi:hypothetical protein